SDVAWPRPHIRPRRAARRAAFSRSAAIRVVTAARWSGSLAWRSPSRTETPSTTRSVVPSENVAILSSSPNTSSHLRDGVDGHRDARDDDDECAQCREEADDAALEAEPLERPLRQDGGEPHSGDADCEPGAEGDDQDEAERQPVEGDRREQHDERRRAREESARDPDREQRARGDVLTVCMAVRMRVAVAMSVRTAMPPARCEDGEADPDDEQPGSEVQPGIKVIRDDEVREQQGDETEREYAGRVSRRDDQAEERRVTGRAALADEVCGHDRLAVPRR